MKIYSKFKIRLVISLIFILNNLIGENLDTRYQYNDNGRVIIPDNNKIKSLPKDGGNLWNRLIFENSPYLLQHAANPVEWYPWGQEAFDLAKKLNKPIFLSIGYTTCHWCHVMEHESFEDVEVANLMNDAFINIKVDREERPDIDNVYMEVTQRLTGRGGWPMTVIMTPDKKPFFAGTYFPKNSRPNYNRVGMLDLIPEMNELWITKQDSLLNSADAIVSDVVKSNLSKINKSQIPLNQNILDKSFNSFNNRFDDIYGGFEGSRNKFPKPHDYSFLARYYNKTKDQRALDIINKSLYSMKSGGIYDHIGFGFHRYSTDKKWLVPHFEKMLYDQAMIIHAYLDAFLLTNDIYYANVVNEICEYVLRDMTDESGGFYSAEDADSQGEEGTFYIWETDELKKILNDDDYNFISNVLNINENGNCRVEGHRTNIPHFNKNWNEISEEYNIDEKLLKENYHRIRKIIFDNRETRVHPQKDDKILTDWNGLMISALSRASVILDNNLYLSAAQKSADFIIENLIHDNGSLLKRHRNGNSGIDGMIEDYAFFIWGLIELYQASFDSKYISVSVDLSNYQINHFWDHEDKGFFFTSDISENLFIRNKEVYDGAIPSGNSVSAYNFIRLARILSIHEYEEISYHIVSAFAPKLNRYSTGSTMLLHAIDFMQGPSFEIIIRGNRYKAKNIIKNIHKNSQFNKVVIFNDDDNKLFSFLNNYPPSENNNPLVYVCQNHSCQLPTNDLSKINDMLK